MRVVSPRNIFCGRCRRVACRHSVLCLQLAALQGLGVRIAIDDVGTDRDAIGTVRNSTTIVEPLVDLARNMRMDAVAEGVENFEQVMHPRTLGLRLAQGYVFAPPLPGSSFLLLQAAAADATERIRAVA